VFFLMGNLVQSFDCKLTYNCYSSFYIMGVQCGEVFVQRFFFKFWSLFIVSGVVIALDQWTKWLVRENIPFAQQWLPKGFEWLMPYARFVHWSNTGAAFGMFQGGSLVFSVLAFLVITLIVYYFPQIDPEDWIFRFALSLQLGGAAGNLISRLTMGGKVTDFISVGSFPVFNIADSAISIGVAVLLIGMWVKERQLRKAQLVESNLGESDSPGA
jgi:signal peptidase II